MNQPQPPVAHSAGWVTQTYISFAVGPHRARPVQGSGLRTLPRPRGR